ncbi:MAG: CapA family protein [Eggerthellaceae bacterium]|nr:CapA family protein [Eggerthellaceae bacterium]
MVHTRKPDTAKRKSAASARKPTPRRAPRTTRSAHVAAPRAARTPYAVAPHATRTARTAVPRVAILALAVVAVTVILVVVFTQCTLNRQSPDAEPVADAAANRRVSFVAVGDNLPEISIANWADSLAGEAGDGTYDYAPAYAPVKSYIEGADLAYVSQEVHLGGEDIGPRGWPSFNTTDSMADAIVSTGFDLVASASNHAYDWGTFGAIEHSRSIWDAQPVAFTGTATSAEQAAELALVERNGITFALLNYTYGVNGFSQADLPAYTVNLIDEDRIRADVAQAKEAADVVLVAMHWGTENLMEADEDQLRWAQLLADLEVDMVIGSHPHVIGPLAWVEGATGHRTLVAYSLGNFLSNHNSPAISNELEGMLTCDFVGNEDGGVSVENAAWTPLVNHADADGSFGVYALRDYSEELAARHTLLGELDDPIGQLRDITHEVVGEEFEIRE